ncbi:MAG: prephenate dehydratase [Candidatus Latescibacteria bacterium]|nr:prephenate dehydratase [Candidatus Latescibacterota bacterium]
MKRIAFQGELGAYSELATYEFFGRDVTVVPRTSFADVFDAVTNGDADHGIIPIENSLAGSIHENYDLLLERNLVITGEIKLRIIHNLIVNAGTRLQDIKRVYSHPQALSQCKDFLQAMSGIEQISVNDTAASARKIKDKGLKDEAAIASGQAAVDYGLEILKTGIESNHKNFTRFLILSKELMEKVENSKTSIVYASKNIPGALFKSLSVFALRDIDLYKIESRPIPGSPWEYLFYLDFNGDIRDEVCQLAINHLKEIASILKVLGSYKKGDEVISKIQGRNE